MPSVRCMDRSLNTQLKRDAHRMAITCIEHFCREAKNPRVFNRFQEAFVYSLRDFVEYSLLGEPRHAEEKLQEVESWIKRAKALNGSTDESESDSTQRRRRDTGPRDERGRYRRRTADPGTLTPTR